MRLRDRVAVVTGAASGLGLATATAFAREGALVAINDLSADAADKAAAGMGPSHIGVAGDVSREADAEEIVRAVQARFGRVDILVNNAGMPDSFVPTVDQPLAHWQKLIDVHLTGSYLMARTVARGMIVQGSGVVLNVSSIAGLHGLPVRTAYSTAKAGVVMLTRVLASEWARHGVRVNAVAPGYIATPFTERLIAEGKLDGRKVRRRTPMGRMGRPQDVADAMVFLASDEAAYITGAVLPVDGGYGAYGAPGDAFDLGETAA